MNLEKVSGYKIIHRNLVRLVIRTKLPKRGKRTVPTLIRQWGKEIRHRSKQRKDVLEDSLL